MAKRKQPRDHEMLEDAPAGKGKNKDEEDESDQVDLDPTLD
jgi:hypothetical protein